MVSNIIYDEEITLDLCIKEDSQDNCIENYEEL